MSERKHNHGEAFALMTYRCDAGCHTEVIWNSRDGVTPFIVRSRDGQHQMQHVDWRRRDIYAPDHKPQPGDRIFVGTTKERAREHAETYVSRVCDGRPDAIGPDGHWPTREACVDYFAEKFYSEHGEGESPDLITVTATPPREAGERTNEQ
jgi:hypothetical protein